MSPLAEQPPVKPERAASRVDDAYRTLKEAIRDNVFAPGHQGSEQEIADRLAMSRTPVHEALIRLQEEGLVRILPKRGILVCPLTPEDMREVYDVIVALEGAAVELLAALPPQARAAALAGLEAENREMRSALQRDDLDAWAAADDRFHRAVIGSCGNGRIARMATTILDQSHRARMMTLRLRARPGRSVDDHAAIVAAIADGDAAAAFERTRDHRRRARDELLPLLDRLGMKRL